MDSDDEMDQMFNTLQTQGSIRLGEEEKKQLDNARLENEEEKNSWWTYLLVIGVIVVLLLILILWWTMSPGKKKTISTIDFFNAIRDPPME